MLVKSYGRTHIFLCVHCDLDLRGMTVGQGHDTPLVMVMGNPCVKCPDPTRQWGVMARTRIFGMCALWHWPWKYEIGWRSWHTLWSWTTIVWNIFQIRQGGEKLWPGHDVNRRTDRRTDRQTGWFLYTPKLHFAAGGGGGLTPNFVCGGINIFSYWSPV